jgi:hypothetical protein
LTDADGPHPILIAPPEGTPHETSLKIASLAPQVLDQLRKLNGIADVECLKASA